MSQRLPEIPSASSIEQLRQRLLAQHPQLEWVGSDDPARLQRLSRDYYDYSPLLRPRFDGCCAQLVLRPTQIEQVMTVAAACATATIPLTCRGSGSGNYGQCVPLAGGVVLDLSGLNQLRRLDPDTGIVEVEAGCLMGELERQLTTQGRALRLMPSTVRSATIGGFIAGGSGGIGSMRWGFLRDAGNLLGLEVVTVEPEPRLLRLDAQGSEALNHAYGTNGIITALRLPSCEAVDWVQLVVGFATWDQALAAAQHLHCPRAQQPQPARSGGGAADALASGLPAGGRRAPAAAAGRTRRARNLAGADAPAGR